MAAAPVQDPLNGNLLDWRTLAAMIASFVLLIVIGVVTVVLSWRTTDAQRWVTHTVQVRENAGQLLNAVIFAEAATRGYLISGDEVFLQQATEVRKHIPDLENRLANLVSDNDAQQARIARLKPIIDARLEGLDRAIAARKTLGEKAFMAMPMNASGRLAMDDVRAAIREISGAEGKLFGTRQKAAHDIATALTSTILAGVIVSLALGLFVAFAALRYVRSLEFRNEALHRAVRAQEKAETQLRQAQKMEALGRLTGGAAHDFNNMLAIVIGSLDMLRRRVAESEPRILQLVESALEGAKRAGVLTQRLLAFSRQQPLDPRPTDVNRCVTDMSELLHRTLGENVHVETVLGAGLWPAFVDSPQLESAILNLAVNARDAMAGGGHLTLETANTYLDDAYASANDDVNPGQYVMVAITDTGGGMDQDTIDKAFEPFFTTKPTGSGTGLGLSQVHGFVKQSGGHVKLYSEPGVGTTVKLYLPRSTGAEERRAEITPEILPGIAGAHILLVEDEAGVRKFAADALKELGCTVAQAQDFDSALEQLDAHPEIDVMLTDVVMPGKNGRLLADEACRRRPGLKVLFMTGYTRNAIVHNGVLDLGTRLITKPFTLSQLEAELRSVIKAKA